MGRSGIVGQLVQAHLLALQLGDELAQIFVQEDRDRVAAIAVHVDQRVERALGAGEHPVDRPLLVPFHVVGVEILGEVPANVFAKRLLNEAQVLAKGVFAKGHAQELAEAVGDVVGEPVGVEHRDDIVLVRHEDRIRHTGEVIGQRLALIGEDQSGRVETVAAEHAANRVGEELGHGVGAQAGLVGRRVVLDAIAIGGIAGEGDLVQRHLGGQLVLQAIGVDKDAIVLFLQPLHLIRHVLPVGAEGGVCGFQRLGAVIGMEHRERSKIPGGFVSVPVRLGKLHQLTGGRCIICQIKPRKSPNCPIAIVYCRIQEI